MNINLEKNKPWLLVCTTQNYLNWITDLTVKENYIISWSKDRRKSLQTWDRKVFPSIKNVDHKRQNFWFLIEHPREWKCKHILRENIHHSYICKGLWSRIYREVIWLNNRKDKTLKIVKIVDDVKENGEARNFENHLIHISNEKSGKNGQNQNLQNSGNYPKVHSNPEHDSSGKTAFVKNNELCIILTHSHFPLSGSTLSPLG